MLLAALALSQLLRVSSETICSPAPKAVFFIIDTSRSVPQSEFFELIGFTSSLLDTLKAEYEGALVSGFCTFSKTVKRVVKLTNETSELNEKLEGLKYNPSATNINLGIIQSIVSYKKMTRENPMWADSLTKYLVVLMTDGRPKGGARGIKKSRRAARSLSIELPNSKLIYMPIGDDPYMRLFHGMNVATIDPIKNLNRDTVVASTDVYSRTSAKIECAPSGPSSPTVSETEVTDTPSQPPITLSPSNSDGNSTENPVSTHVPSRNPTHSLNNNPTTSPIIDKNNTPTTSPIIEKNNTPTTSPILEKNNTPTTSPTIDENSTPTFTPTIEDETPITQAPSSSDAALNFEPFPENSDFRKAMTVISIIIIAMTLITFSTLTAVEGQFLDRSIVNAVEVISFASFIASTAMLDMPTMPSAYYNYAVSLKWVNFLFFQSAYVGGTRRLNENEATAIERFCESVGIDPNMLFLFTMIGIVIVYVACLFVYAAVGIFKSMYQKEKSGLLQPKMIRRFAKEVCVRIVYYCAYPISIAVVYQFYLTTSIVEPNGKSEQIVLLVLATMCLLGFAMVIFFGTKITRRFEQIEQADDKCDDYFTFRCLVEDWKLDRRYFWVIRMATVWTRALFLGCVRRPSPIQASVFLVSACLYFVLLIVLMPYKYVSQNRIAMIIAIAYILNTILLLVFATTDYNKNMDWGTVQLVVSVVVIVGVGVLCISKRLQSYMERRKKYDSPDMLESDNNGESFEALNDDDK